MIRIFVNLLIILVITHWIKPSKSFLKITPVHTYIFTDPTNLTEKSKFFFEILPFFTKSTDSKKISNYFLPFNSTQLLTTEKDSPNFFKANINANQINIDYEDNLFESITQFSPEHKNVGLLFHINSYLKNFWIDLMTPISKVSNNMNLDEFIINEGLDLVYDSATNVKQAFKQPSWNYGKIDGKKMKTGIADIDLKLGNSYTCNNFSSHPFIGLIIPTGNKTNSQFLFEPIVGNNKHFALQAGVFNFLEIKNNLFIYLYANISYLFKNKQIRMFDLIDKDWSRYMMIYSSPSAALKAFNNAGTPENGDKGSPGINYFTRECEVSPNLEFQSTFRIWFIKNQIKNELGLSLFARSAEDINFYKSTENAALVGTAEAGTTSDARTINCNYIGTRYDNAQDSKINENTYASIDENTINCKPAAAPAGMSLTFFYKIQYLYKNAKFNLATSYQFSSDIGLINLFSIWGGITYEF